MARRKDLLMDVNLNREKILFDCLRDPSPLGVTLCEEEECQSMDKIV